MPTLVNTIDSKELYAARAVADAAGNDIAQTYATKAELPTQVQSDWNQSVASAPDFIKNRPLSRLVPASTVYDQDMVLTVDASGNAGWGGAYILVAVSMMGPSDTIAQTMLDCWNYKQVVLQDPTYGKNLPLTSITYDGQGYDLHNRVFNGGGVYDGKLYSISVFWNSDSGSWSWTSTETLVPDELTAGSGVEIVSDVINAKVDGTTVTFDENGRLTATGGGSTYTAGNGIDITSDVISVDTSVVATQADLAGKEDDFDAGSGLEFTTDGQGNRVLQVEAPVDIVAGPGIVVDNPDGNTLRVSVASNYEVELYSHTSVANNAANTVLNMNEPVTNFERIRVECWNREFNTMRRDFEFTLSDSTTSTCFIADMDASQSTGNQQRINIGIGYNSDGNLVDLFHGLFFGNGSSYTNGNDRGLGIHRVVGIHRINGGN